MRLVHITTIPETLRFFRGQLRRVREAGVDVTLISSPGPDLDWVGATEGASTVAVPMRRAISPFHDIRALWALVRTLRAIRPDVLHVHTPKAALLGIIAGSLARVPLRIYQVHGLVFATQHGWRRGIALASERLTSALAHRVLCVGASLRDAYLKAGLVSPRKVGVVAAGSINGVDALGRFNPMSFSPDAKRLTRASLGVAEAEPVVGFVGRLVRDKGIAELVHAWRLVRDAVPDGHLLVVGRFEDRDAVDQSIRVALERDPRVHLVGDVPEPEHYFAVMTVLALPTHREGFGVVAIEAAAMEIPVVATRTTGCVDAVNDGITGTLVPVGDAEGLARSIIAYLTDRELRRRHGAAGRSRVLAEFRPGQLAHGFLLEYGVTVPDPLRADD